MRTLEILFWADKLFSKGTVEDVAVENYTSQYKPWKDCLSVPRKGDYINVTDKQTELSSAHVVTEVYWHTPVKVVCFIDE